MDTLLTDMNRMLRLVVNVFTLISLISADESCWTIKSQPGQKPRFHKVVCHFNCCGSGASQYCCWEPGVVNILAVICGLMVLGILGYVAYTCLYKRGCSCRANPQLQVLQQRQISPAFGYSVPAPDYPTTPGYPTAPGYSSSTSGYPATKSGYPATTSCYPSSTSGFPAPAFCYPAPASGYPAKTSGYPATTSGYPATTSGYPATTSAPFPSTVAASVSAPASGYPVQK